MKGGPGTNGPSKGSCQAEYPHEAGAWGKPLCSLVTVRLASVGSVQSSSLVPFSKGYGLVLSSRPSYRPGASLIDLDEEVQGLCQSRSEQRRAEAQNLATSTVIPSDPVRSIATWTRRHLLVRRERREGHRQAARCRDRSAQINIDHAVSPERPIDVGLSNECELHRRNCNN